MEIGFPWQNTVVGCGSNQRRKMRQILSIFCGILFLLSLASPVGAEKYDKRVLVGADFSGQDLRTSQFNKTVLREAKFVGANLRGVSLFGADLTDADFTGANLTNATIDTAKMTRTNLTNAILEGAFVYGVNFKGAVIKGADFTDVDLREAVRSDLCKVAEGTNPTTGRKTRDTLLCDDL